jgi:UDP-N-acetyl-2-amino-2-deoxyglucuronate dehydrogenase
MNNNVTRLAVIGLGMASKPHLAALRQLAPAIEVAGVYARNAERRASVAAHTGCRDYDSIAAICSDSSVDGAIIITPPNARIEIVRSLAAAGKHVLMEKPVERNLVNAEAIVKICEDAEVSLGIVLQHRFRAGAIALSDLVQSGKLGQIHLVRVVLPWWRDQSYYDQPGRGTYEMDGGGVLITQAIHVIDLMLSLTGAVSVVSAIIGKTPLHDMEAEDFASASLRWDRSQPLLPVIPVGLKPLKLIPSMRLCG